MNQLLLDFERRLSLGSVECARVLGIAYSTYAAYRSALRVLPQYHVNQCHLVMLLSKPMRQVYLQGRLNGH